MKISKKEKLLLVMLLAILGSVVYYQFVYTKQQDQITGLQQEQQEIQARYNEIMETISTLENRQKKIDVLYTNISNKSEQYYPTLIQENIILEIDQLLKEHQISANISFTEVTVSNVEGFGATSIESTTSSIQSLIEQYNNPGKITETENEGETTVDNTSSTSTTVEQMTLSVTFNSTYDALKTFLDAAQIYERQLVITNISVTPGTNDNISGTFNIELYAFPKFNGIDDSYLEWTLENTYGKTSPFSSGSATGAYRDELNLTVDTNPNFLVILKSITSTLPTFMMGATGDDSDETYITSSNQEILPVTLTLTQEGEDYYYHYEADDMSYPVSGNKPFVPQDSIQIQISSEARLTTDDLSGIELNVVNETDKKVSITIENDDEINPRVSVVTDATNTDIIKK